VDGLASEKSRPALRRDAWERRQETFSGFDCPEHHLAIIACTIDMIHRTHSEILKNKI
jgi:hypothetical protein